MSHSSLTAKYRPQRFADVAGQEIVRTVLSRAAAEDRIAPAYLFSGTRGVGKTTVARILAKAVNCAHAPTAEPCNECPACRQITRGAGVDVIEIDGASNRGIDDARRLREDIGFAPMEFRYKVFIIDEAHMLTREAFNALLKTLEEPPGHVTFILATTEPHKFPATIISRCQHYIFQRLPEAELAAHLRNILGQEGAEYEDGALRLIAKRASGSVRDSMSLLGQVMALGQGKVREAGVRSILGLAGREVFEGLFAAMREQDVLAVSALLRSILDQGLDLGFFLRELSQMWRNLFLLSQAGDRGLEILEMPGEEAATWLAWSKAFPLSQIHAAWQMTLEGQRKVLQSLEPALALELLLLNLTLLPRLLDLEALSTPAAGSVSPSFAPRPPERDSAASAFSPGQGPAQGRSEAGTPRPQPENAAPGAGALANGAFVTPPRLKVPGAPPGPAAAPLPPPQGPRTWEGFLGYCRQAGPQAGHAALIQDLGRAQGQIQGEEVGITCANEFMRGKILDKKAFHWLTSAARAFFGPQVELRVELGAAAGPSIRDRRKQVQEHPAVKGLQAEMDAQLINGSIRSESNS